MFNNRTVMPLGLGAMPMLGQMQMQRPMMGPMPMMQPQQQPGLLDSLKPAMGLLSNPAFQGLLKQQWNQPTNMFDQGQPLSGLLSDGGLATDAALAAGLGPVGPW